MRELTFAGFLKQYVRSLSLSDTNGLYRLADEASSTNLRLQAPLFLYSLLSGKEQLLLSAVKSPKLKQEYAGMLSKYNRESLEQALQNEDPLLSDGYNKVYRSYLYAKNRKQNDNHTKMLMRNYITRLQRKRTSALIVCITV